MEKEKFEEALKDAEAIATGKIVEAKELVLKSATTQYYRIEALKRGKDLLFHIDILVSSVPFPVFFRLINRIIHATYRFIPFHFRKTIDRIPTKLINSICLTIYDAASHFNFDAFVDILFDSLVKEFQTFDNPNVPSYIPDQLNLEKLEKLFTTFKDAGLTVEK
ncbi:MAG: hypothetical protein QXG39_01885 [Candidatus Aenigmatarchaeota archaeon]